MDSYDYQLLAHNYDYYYDDFMDGYPSAQLNMDVKSANLKKMLQDENEEDRFLEWHKCDKDLGQPKGFTIMIDFSVFKKVLLNLNPFSSPKLKMQFYLFTREFPNCGRELSVEDSSIYMAGLNASHPTRILVHGWMSHSRGTFNRDIKNAYLQRGDYNVIVADWSANAANINYFHVVKLIDIFGEQLARFTRHLYKKVHINFNDIYIVGHSLGAQIAGAAGKRVRPYRYNTIFALDPAGPRFRQRTADFRIDPTDAKYVESIQTSVILGFLEPTGNATFYPNYGRYQKKCYIVGCSHIRAYKMFAESINSPRGFWGIRCWRRKPKWQCDDMQDNAFKMGGDPSMPKSGIFYVNTNARAPYALGRMLSAESMMEV